MLSTWKPRQPGPSACFTPPPSLPFRSPAAVFVCHCAARHLPAALPQRGAGHEQHQGEREGEWGWGWRGIPDSTFPLGWDPRPHGVRIPSVPPPCTDGQPARPLPRPGAHRRRAQRPPHRRALACKVPFGREAARWCRLWPCASPLSHCSPTIQRPLGQPTCSNR